MAKRKKTLKAKRTQASTVKKTAVTCGLVLCLGSAELYAKPQFLLGVYPSVSIPLSIGDGPLGSYAASDKIPLAVGGAGRFTVRPVPVLDLFAEGSYEVLMYPYHPNNDLTKTERKNFSLISGTVGAGYNVPFSDRLSLNAAVKAGVGVLQNKPQLKVEASVGLTYRARPALSINTDINGSFNGPQVIPVGIRPGVTVNLNELFVRNANINIEVIDQQPVFPVLYSWYELNPFGTVRIANLEDGKISNVKVSFYQPQYMAQPNLCGEIELLEKEEYFDCDLTAFFNERMLELTELTDTKAIISVEYEFLGQKRKKEYTATIPVYDRNSMNWADDRRAASFVSSKDPAAMWFAKYVTSVIRDNLRAGVPENVQYAMGIFETLDQFGINYVVDPNSAYADNIGGESADFLQFPYQTLMYRGGDCDDLSILVCSLFEAVGINTAFITVPGHIYMAFDTGLSEEEAKNQFSDMTQLICRDDKVWMPLEITISNEGFSKAWRVGAREWNVAEENDAAAIFPMADSWLVYKPVSIPSAEANFDMPDRKLVAKLFDHRVEEWVMKEIEPAVIEYKNLLSQKYDKAVSNNLGVLYSRYGLFSEAEEQFKALRKAGYMPAVINTANVYFAKQSYNRALASYKAVLREEEENDLALLGIARSQWELGNFGECDKYYDQLKKQNPKLAAKYTYLASFVETKGRAYNLAGRLDTMSWAVQKTDALLPKEKELIEEAKLSFEPEPEFELPPLDVNDENRFEMDMVPEAKKRETEEDLLSEIAEEEKAEIAASENNVSPAGLVMNTEMALPEFLFADIKNLTPDTDFEPVKEEPEETLLASVTSTEETQSVQNSLLALPSVTENNNETVVTREVPRFTKSPSAEWAPEEVFNVTVIPGMRSFEEEMGNTQNEKAFLYAEDETDSDDVENFDVFADTDTNKTLVKAEEEKEETVNPFGSFFEDPSEAFIPVSSDNLQEVVEKKIEIISQYDNSEQNETVMENQSVTEEINNEENITAENKETEETAVETGKVEQKKSGAKTGAAAALGAVLLSVVSAVLIKRRRNRKAGEGK